MASWHMFVLADHDIVSHEIKSRGSWEHNEVMAMIDKMREYRDTPEGQASGQNGTFIDIGGNIGGLCPASVSAGQSWCAHVLQETYVMPVNKRGSTYEYQA